MISREDAVAAIGFDGNSALVDSALKKQCSGMNTLELANAGYYRAAAASALYSGKEGELEEVAAIYNKASSSSYAAEALPRLFGVTRISVTKTLVL